MPSPTETLLYDGFSEFSLGIDSGIAPQSLPKNQCAFAINTSFRGDFASDRTPFRKLPIDPSLLNLIASALNQGPFQAANSFKADSNPESIIVSAGGRLFEIFPTSVTTIPSTGSEITIPGDSNPPAIQQNWMQQAERWMVVQDGLSNPIFYDGVSSRRSEVAISVVGTTAANFTTIPPIGGTVDITLTAPFSGLLNSVLTFNELDTNGNVFKTANYMVTKVNGNAAQYQVVLKNLSDTEGNIYSNNTQLVVQPSNLGVVVSPLGSGPTNFNMGISSALPIYVVVNSTVLISGNAFKITSIAANRLSMTVQKVVSTSPSPNLNDKVILQNYNAPNVVVGVLESSLNAPAIGSNVTAFLQAQFTQSNGQILFIGNGQYKVVSSQINPPAPSTTVTIQNLNDVPTLNPLIANTYILPQAGSTFTNLPELPPGRMGAYGQGRMWQSGVDGISFIAGDIVGGASGSPAFNGRDAVLKVTENSLLAQGGAFRVPSAGEVITAMAFSAILDSSLGQGPLQVFTNKNIFSCNTPADRTTWQSLTTPILTQSLKGSGASSQYGVVPVNADLIFRSPDGQIRSQLLSRLDFNRWGNTPASFEETRIIQAENLDLMNFCSGIEFDNRVFISCNPTQASNGVIWNGMMVLNLDPLSTLGEKGNSIWEGFWNGLNVLQIIRFSNVQRAFMLAINSTTNEFELWEMMPTSSFPFDNSTNPITWQLESPPLFRDVKGKGLFDLIKLEDGEMYVNDVIGKVFFTVEYKADFDNCWHPWNSWFVCAQQGTDPNSTYQQYRRRMGFGQPQAVGINCNVNTDMNPMYGTMFQVRITVQGHCQINGCKLAASLVPQPRFEPPICNE